MQPISSNHCFYHVTIPFLSHAEKQNRHGLRKEDLSMKSIKNMFLREWKYIPLH